MDIPAPLKDLQRRPIIKGQSALATHSPHMTGKVVMWPRVCPSNSRQLRRWGSKRFLNTMTVSKTIIFLHWNLIPLNKTRLQTPHPSLDGSAMKVSNPLPSFFAVPRLRLCTSKMGWCGTGCRFNKPCKNPQVICGEPMACLSPPSGVTKKKWSGKTWPQARGWWFDGVDKSIYEHCLVDNFVILGWHVYKSSHFCVNSSDSSLLSALEPWNCCFWSTPFCGKWGGFVPPTSWETLSQLNMSFYLVTFLQCGVRWKSFENRFMEYAIPPLSRWWEGHALCRRRLPETCWRVYSQTVAGKSQNEIGFLFCQLDSVPPLHRTGKQRPHKPCDVGDKLGKNHQQ